MSTFIKRTPQAKPSTATPTATNPSTTQPHKPSLASTHQQQPQLSLPGTKPSVHNGQLLISSGLADLDSHLGGGIPLGSVILLFEDSVSTYANHLLNYYVSEGISCGHKVFHMGTPCDLEHVLPLNYTRYQAENPSQSSSSSSSSSASSPATGENNSPITKNQQQKMMMQQQSSADLKISWRYNQFVQDQIALKQQSIKNRTVSTSSSSGSGSSGSGSGGGGSSSPSKKLVGSVQCHEYDLSKSVQHELIERARNDGLLVELDMFHNAKLSNLLQLLRREQLEQLLLINKKSDQRKTEEEENEKKMSNRHQFMGRVNRIAIRSLNLMLDEGDAQCLHSVAQFFHMLRILCRKSLSTAFITVPKHHSNHALVETIQATCCDIVLRMDSFVGEHINVSEWEMSEYTGLFHIEKLPRMNTLAPYLPDTLNYAFKVKRRKIYIERMSAPPEETRSATVKDRPRYLVEGAAAAASSSVGCGSSSSGNKNDLDF